MFAFLKAGAEGFGLDEDRLPISFSRHVRGDTDQAVEESDGDGDTPQAVLTDHVECVAQDFREPIYVAQYNARRSFVIAAEIAGKSRFASVQSAPLIRSIQLIAVNGSLIPGESARTAISTSCRVA